MRKYYFNPRWWMRLQILKFVDGTGTRIYTLWMVRRVRKPEIEPPLPPTHAFPAKITYFYHAFFYLSLIRRHHGHIRLPSNALRTDYESRELRRCTTRYLHALENPYIQNARLWLKETQKSSLIRIQIFNHPEQTKNLKEMRKISEGLWKRGTKGESNAQSVTTSNRTCYHSKASVFFRVYSLDFRGTKQSGKAE